MDRDEFMELVYDTFADEPDNVLANGIIEAADAYVEHEKAQLFSEDTTKDAISRQAAIDIERNATVDTNPSHFEAHQKFTQFMDDAEVSSFGRWQWANGFNTALTAVRIDLKKLPPAQPEPKWVPCRNDLPDIGVTVLFCDVDGDEFIGHRASDYWWSVDDKVKSVIAWMPLPKPFKGGINEIN